MSEAKQTEPKALVFLRDGRIRVADAEDVGLLPHAVEIRLRRRDPTDRTPDLDVFPWGEVARVYVGIAAMRQGQWLPHVDVAERRGSGGTKIYRRLPTPTKGPRLIATSHPSTRYLPPLAGPLVHQGDGLASLFRDSARGGVCPPGASI